MTRQLRKAPEIIICRVYYSLVRNCIRSDLCISDHVAACGPRGAEKFQYMVGVVSGWIKRSRDLAIMPGLDDLCYLHQ